MAAAKRGIAADLSACARGGSLPPFSALRPLLSAPTLELVAELGFARATPVQAATIPLLTSNKVRGFTRARIALRL